MALIFVRVGLIEGVKITQCNGTKFEQSKESTQQTRENKISFNTKKSTNDGFADPCTPTIIVPICEGM